MLRVHNLIKNALHNFVAPNFCFLILCESTSIDCTFVPVLNLSQSIEAGTLIKFFET